MEQEGKRRRMGRSGVSGDVCMFRVALHAILAIYLSCSDPSIHSGRY